MTGGASPPDQLVVEQLGRPGRPGRWSWLATGLLAALLLAPWRPDDIVEWLLYRRLVAESAAPGLD
ncbi:MAG: hypothetical protein HYU75_03960, partial [Betaproteobacteria bacterium]|nr:hypothetical protein [Betaproteobacteria bacterium]